MSVVIPSGYSSARLIVVMGVTGCGKSTVGRLLADSCDAGYIEGDDYHSPENKAKMHAGNALTDDDRWPWLRKVAQTLKSHRGKSIASCSSLKRVYRDFMTRIADEPVLFIYLSGSTKTLVDRLAARQGHFMNKALLSSQLETLEVPGVDEYSLTVSIEQPVAKVVEQVRRNLE